MGYLSMLALVHVGKDPDKRLLIHEMEKETTII